MQTCNFAVPSSQFTPEGDRIKGTLVKMDKCCKHYSRRLDDKK